MKYVTLPAKIFSFIFDAFQDILKCQKLTRDPHPLDEADADDYPGGEEATKEGPVDAAEVVPGDCAVAAAHVLLAEESERSAALRAERDVLRQT